MDRGDVTVWIDQVRAFAERSLRELSGNRIMLFWAFVFPSVMYLLSVELGPTDTGSIQRAVMAVANGMFGSMFVCLFIFGEQLVTDVEDQRYEVYRALPIHPFADLMGRMVSVLCFAFGAFASTLFVAALTGASFDLHGVSSVLITVVAGTLCCVLWMVVAVPVVVVTEDERYAGFITTGIAVGTFMLTGYNGVLPALFPFEEWLLNYLPNALPTRLLVSHLVDVDQSVAIELSRAALPTNTAYLGLLMGYAVVCLTVGSAVFHRSLYKRGEWS
ncbi:ABC transporter permease [Halocatena salina]|uniref:ABC transporter permease n=1 Tax=Halocatena salina TaxID=2934340 RepID=A0A8U0A5B2_9EURY|nr:ABC transporter permease [Halocatena salina]UPM44400.1 ABC transporter permease [Halocatena salina]